VTYSESLNPAVIRLTPRQQPVVWGGHLLSERLGKPVSDEAVGESWEVWEGDPVAAGTYEGRTLQQLSTQFPVDLMGQLPVVRGWNRFPLLTKFIDAHESLSVQVHPDDVEARRLEGQPNGKTEAWHIIAAADDAWIIHGLTREIGASDFRDMLERGTAESLLRKVPAAAGQTIFVPARTVHAIGPGVLLHEVQQTSDVTYRLYDWNRQEHGSPRELHLDKGLEVAILHPSPDPVVTPLTWQDNGVAVSAILASEYFTVKKVTFPGGLTLDTGGESFHILSVLTGNCRNESASDTAEMSLGQSVVLPANFGAYQISSAAEAQVLVEYIAAHEALAEEAQENGIDPKSVSAFLDQFRSARP